MINSITFALFPFLMSLFVMSVCLQVVKTCTIHVAYINVMDTIARIFGIMRK